MWLDRMALSSWTLRWRDVVYNKLNTSQQKSLSQLRTWSSFSANSQSSTSRWSFATSSTEHFLLATVETLFSSLRASNLDRDEMPSFDDNNRSVRRASASLLIVGVVSTVGKRRGVLQPLDVKSMRIMRTSASVNFSLQNGQTGSRCGVVFV